MAKPPDPWAELFRAALALKVTEPTGGGWMTAKEFCKRSGCGEGKGGVALRQGMLSGKLEKFVGSQIANGKSRTQIWYRPATKTNRPKPPKLPPS